MTKIAFHIVNMNSPCTDPIQLAADIIAEEGVCLDIDTSDHILVASEDAQTVDDILQTNGFGYSKWLKEA